MTYRVVIVYETSLRLIDSQKYRILFKYSNQDCMLVMMYLVFIKIHTKFPLNKSLHFFRKIDGFYNLSSLHYCYSRTLVVLPMVAPMLYIPVNFESYLIVLVCF